MSETLLDRFKNWLDLKSPQERMDERFNNGIEVAWLAPSPEKTQAIAMVMKGVTRKVKSNAKEVEQDFREAMKRNNFSETDVEAIRDNIKKFIANNRDTKGNFAMRISGESLDNVINGDGEFKNQFQVGSSGGLLDPELRAKISRQNFGTRYKNDGNLFLYTNEDNLKLMPKSLQRSEKYGYAPKFSNDYDADFYGDYVVNFFPDNVKNRTTITDNDSLNDRRLVPILMNDEDTWAGMLDRRNFNTYTEQELRDFLKQRKERWKDKSPRGYRELQYHGPLGLDDVESIDMPYGYKKSDLEKSWMDKADQFHFNIRSDGRIIYKWGSRK